MQKVSSLGIRVQAAGFIPLNPNADQLAREIVPLGEPIKGLPSNVLLHHLPLKLDAVRTLLSGHGFHLSKAQNTCQITNFKLSGSRGALHTHGTFETWRRAPTTASLDRLRELAKQPNQPVTVHLTAHGFSNGMTEVGYRLPARKPGELNPLVDPEGFLAQLASMR